MEAELTRAQEWTLYVCPNCGADYPIHLLRGDLTKFCDACKTGDGHGVRLERIEVSPASHLTEYRTEAARLREALEEIHTYLRLKPGEDHTEIGRACGVDACVLCLAESVARSALEAQGNE